MGIFCRNFCVGCGGFPQGRSVWCGECYSESPIDPFPRLQTVEPEDKSEVLLDKTDLEGTGAEETEITSWVSLLSATFATSGT